jgi:predicted nucleic acid-binding protein
LYLETSVISYLTARRSRDIVIAAHQQLTRRWWRSRNSYRLFVSQIVRDEAAVGDRAARARRLRALRGVPVLAVNDEATRLAGELVRRGALPRKATVDAFTSVSLPLTRSSIC